MTYYPENLAYGLLLKFRSIRNFSTRYENLVPLSRLSAPDLQDFEEAYRLSGQFIKKWVQAGGKIMGGTDDPQAGTSGLSVHMEMAMLVEVGLTPMQALQAQTSWAAEMLTARRKVPARPPVGLIAQGAFADLVILGADPLENIDNSRKIEHVMKGGKFVELGYTPYYSIPREIQHVQGQCVRFKPPIFRLGPLVQAARLPSSEPFVARFKSTVLVSVFLFFVHILH